MKELNGSVLPTYQRGFHTPNKDVKGKIKRMSKKCGCEFKLKTVEEPIYVCNIVVKKGTHNHNIGKDLHGHPCVGRHKEGEVNEGKRLHKGNAKPLKIRSTINSSPGNLTKENNKTTPRSISRGRK